MINELSIEEWLDKEKKYFTNLYLAKLMDSCTSPEDVAENVKECKEAIALSNKELPRSRFDNPEYRQILSVVDAFDRAGLSPDGRSLIEGDTELLESFYQTVNAIFHTQSIKNTQPPNTRFCVKRKRKKK